MGPAGFTSGGPRPRGADGVAEALAGELGLGIDEARDVVVVGLESGQDVALDVPAALAEPETDEPSTALARPEVVAHERIVAARDVFLARLHRELLRFLTALPRVSEIERLFVTGGGSQMPGVVEQLGEVFGCAPQPLDVLPKLAHDLDEAEVRSIGPRIATAVGLALAMLGGKGGFDFRKEDLVYRRRFDRIKFPLAIACMLAVFLPFIYGVRQYKKLEEAGRRYGELYSVAEGSGARGTAGIQATFWGYVGRLMNDGFPQKVDLDTAEYEALTRELLAADTFDRLGVIRRRLEATLLAKQEDTGIYENLQLPSGVYVLSYFANTVKRVEKQLGSFLITEVKLNLPHVARSRTLSFKAAFRGPQFRERIALLQAAFRDGFGDPLSPFAAGESKGEDPFQSGGEGAYWEYSLDVKEEFETRAPQ